MLKGSRMAITAFRIQNYKSYFDSGEVRISEGFNVVVGQNNAGKSALLEGLSLQHGPVPHRSLRTLPQPTTTLDPGTRINVVFTLRRGELLDLLRTLAPSIFISVPDQPYAPNVLANALSQPNGPETIDFAAEYDANSGNFTSVRSDLFGVAGSQGTVNGRKLNVDPQTGLLERADDANYSLNAHQTAPLTIALALRQRIYSFRAERLQIGESMIGADPTLQPNAANLAQVLNRLQSSNPARWARYVEYVRIVLPHVTQITVPPVQANTVRVLVWSVDPASEREDLAVPLSESGTGIGQVLAILYVVVTADLPRVILIDEPQSFLHPGAVRKLFDILRLHPQHQYVVTTHSPSAVTAATPRTLLLVRAENGESVVESLNAAETRDLRTFLHDVGARLSDVFGADSILWVEGRTEEVCFPLIMAARTDIPISATTVLGVKNTGDFERRNADAVFDLYERLSHGPRLLPPAVGFLFDREDRSETARADLSRRSRGRIRFTTRRMYESYLLNSAAIAALVNQIGGFGDAEIGPGRVAAWINAVRWDRRYFKRAVPEANRVHDYWLREVDGAKLLQDLFLSLSEQRVKYDKVKHGYSLTAWICQHTPEEFDEISSAITELLTTGTPQY